VAYDRVHRRIRDTWTALKRWFQCAEPEAPEEAYVGAPRKPRTPRRRAAAEAEP